MFKFFTFFVVIIVCLAAWWVTVVNPALMVGIMIICLLVTGFRNHIVDFFTYRLFKDTHQ